MKATALMLCAALVAGCARSPENAQADHKVLCDPGTGAAYIVRPGLGDTSFVRPLDNAGALCRKP